MTAPAVDEAAVGGSAARTVTPCKPGWVRGAVRAEAPSTASTVAATIRAMPMWRCPHCGTPQTETARCWVCHRSSTACGTCRHFRRSVAAQLGYCGLDRRRQPLAGDEIRPCWEGWALTGNLRSDPASRSGPASGDATAPATATTARLDFIDVEAGAGDAPITDGAHAPWPNAAAEAGEPRWNLWGDLEG